MTSRVRALVLAAFAAVIAAPAAAQAPDVANFPTRPITLVMPVAAGSAGDVLGRVVSNKMAADLGQPIVNENVTGASGAIGIERMLRAPADGYTILGTGDNQIIITPLFNQGAKFDTFKDFAPITQLAVLDWVLVAHPDFPAKTIADLIKLAKESPGKINFASGGVGTAQQLAMELLMARTGIELMHIPYRGVTPGLNDVVAGQVQLIFTALAVAAPFLPDGRLRVIAAAGPQRIDTLPDVPTVAETVEGYEFGTWTGFLTHAQVPPAIVKRLQASASKAVNDPSIRPQLRAAGFRPVGNTPEEFAAIIKRDYQRIEQIMRTAGLTGKQ